MQKLFLDPRRAVQYLVGSLGGKVVLRTWVPGRTIEARVTFRDLLYGSKINLELLRWRELKAVKESFQGEAERVKSQRLWRKRILLASAV